MKRVCVALLLCVMLLFAVPAFGGQKADLPMVVECIIRNRDFFVQPWALWEYEDYYLYDVNRLNDERIGVILISPSGFEVKLVYDMSISDVIYKDMIIPDKARREAMKHKSISTSDSIKLAKIAVKTSKETN